MASVGAKFLGALGPVVDIFMKLLGGDPNQAVLDGINQIKDKLNALDNKLDQVKNDVSWGLATHVQTAPAGIHAAVQLQSPSMSFMLAPSWPGHWVLTADEDMITSDEHIQ